MSGREEVRKYNARYHGILTLMVVCKSSAPNSISRFSLGESAAGITCIVVLSVLSHGYNIARASVLSFSRCTCGFVKTPIAISSPIVAIDSHVLVAKIAGPKH